MRGTWVRVAYAQPYHHQANGRAERAGQQLRDKLKKLITDQEEPLYNWVELLPKALRHIHDTPGEHGLSPYEIVFGRERPLGGMPYRVVRETFEATEFLDKMDQLRQLVAEKATEAHEKRAKAINGHRKDPPPSRLVTQFGTDPSPKEDETSWNHFGRGRVGCLHEWVTTHTRWR